MDASLDLEDRPIVNHRPGVRGAQCVIVLDAEDALLHLDCTRVAVETGEDQAVWPRLGDPETAGNALGDIPAHGKLTGAGIDANRRVVRKDHVAG